MQAIDEAPALSSLAERLMALKDHFIHTLYDNVCRSLFENHKPLLSVALATSLLRAEGKLDDADLRFLLHGSPVEIKKGLPNPTDFLTKQTWNQVLGLALLPAFERFEQHFANAVDEWKRWLEHPEPEKHAMPGVGPDTTLTPFQQLLPMRVLRLDRLTQSITQFVITTLGESFVHPPAFELRNAFKDSTNLTPFIFILSPGSDPVGEVINLSVELHCHKKLEITSLGQGQGAKAERMIEDAMSRGGWVLLCNCHLAESWMPELERICEGIGASCHRDFRMWLTAAPSAAFPVAILQSGIKLTTEPPKGLRANLQRTYLSLDSRALEGCAQPVPFRKLLFAFAFFHAVVQERRRFGPIGWNIPYDFTNEDFNVCKLQLRIFLDQYSEVPYEVLRTIGARINYGGRVTDDKDKRLISTLLETYVCPDILSPSYTFCSRTEYFCSNAETREEWLEFIRNLPVTAGPEVFGLHPNANISVAVREARQLVHDITTLIPQAGGGDTEADSTLTLAQQAEAATPELFDEVYVAARFPIRYEESMNTVLVQEIERYNRLLSRMRVTLADFQKALKGLVVMSEDLESLGHSLLEGAVPKVWEAYSFLSMKPLPSWLNDVKARVAFLRRWISGGTPATFWMSGLYFPQGFLTGTMQNYARKHHIPIDRITFTFEFANTMIEPMEHPADGCHVSGLWLEGARWVLNDHRLDWSNPKQLFTQMPVVTFLPMPEDVAEARDTGVLYACPSYKVVSRAGALSTTGRSTNFVQMIDVPSGPFTTSVWTKAGVAIFLSLPD
mmetsp:Transcript_44447/g.96710  ORF Transcript_44447/g.96710 Transcript_44447/m.96710 type:complete len:786 (+) Transcript_44447:22-2379(+)